MGSVNVDSNDLENNKKVMREAQGAQGLTKNYIGSVSRLSRLIRGFRKSVMILLREEQCKVA